MPLEEYKASKVVMDQDAARVHAKVKANDIEISAMLLKMGYDRARLDATHAAI